MVDNHPDNCIRHSGGSVFYQVRRLEDIWLEGKHFCCSVLWTNFERSYEFIETIAHCETVIDNFEHWVRSGCPANTRRSGKRKRAKAFAARDDQQPQEKPQKQPKLSVPRGFVHQPNQALNTCTRDAIANTCAILGKFVEYNSLPNFAVTSRSAAILFIERSGLKIAKRHRLSNNFQKIQSLESGVYLAFTHTNGGSSHCIAIDNSTRSAMLWDSFNKSPISYEKENMKWLKCYAFVYKVTLP